MYVRLHFTPLLHTMAAENIRVHKTEADEGNDCGVVKTSLAAAQNFEDRIAEASFRPPTYRPAPRTGNLRDFRPRLQLYLPTHVISNECCILTIALRSGRSTASALSTTSTPGTESTSLMVMPAGTSATASMSVLFALAPTTLSLCATCLSAQAVKISNTSTRTMSSTTPVPSQPTDSLLV